MERHPLLLGALACLATVGCVADATDPGALAAREQPLVLPVFVVLDQTPAWAGTCPSKSPRYHVFMREWNKFACHDIDVGTGVWRGVNGATPGTCTFDWSGADAPQYSVLEANARYGQISYRGESPGEGPLVIQDCSPPCKLHCSELTWAVPISGMGRSPCSACGVVSGGTLHMTVPSFVSTDEYVIRTADGAIFRVVTNGQQVASVHLPFGADGPVDFAWPLLP